MKHRSVVGKDNQAFAANSYFACFPYFPCALIELNSLLALILQDLYQVKSSALGLQTLKAVSVHSY